MHNEVRYLLTIFWPLSSQIITSLLYGFNQYVRYVLESLVKIVIAGELQQVRFPERSLIMSMNWFWDSL